MTPRPPIRFPLMGIGMLALLSGMWAGLGRLGWDWPMLRPTFGLAHGPLMISGFLGTLISLERAVALGRTWTFGAPLLTALGGLALVGGAPHWVAPLFMTLGSFVLVVSFGSLLWQQSTSFTATMALGALAWLIGNGRWLGGAEIPDAVSWWIAFPVLTIAGERLELTRLLPPSQAARRLFAVIVAMLVVGLAIGGIATATGAWVTGGAWVCLAVWLLQYDVARRTVRQTGLTRFTAVCLLTGYVWLCVGGVLAICCGSVIAGPHYDAVLHAVLLGFVFAMIFGHAPIIFPAVLGLALPFRTTFYAHLALLHVSLLARLTGDLVPLTELRQWGGLLNAAAVLLFVANTVGAVIRARLQSPMPATFNNLGEKGHATT
jgi:hypothetical protein